MDTRQFTVYRTTDTSAEWINFDRLLTGAGFLWQPAVATTEDFEPGGQAERLASRTVTFLAEDDTFKYWLVEWRDSYR